MQVYVSLLPSMHAIDEQTEVAVVIDVLRATSVMTKALESGAKSVVTCQEIDEARELARNLQPSPLLCGERECKPIEGFNCGNSPAEYDVSTVADRDLVLTTTNGTRAIAASQQAQQMLIGSFLNLSAIVDHIKSVQRLQLVCAGTNGEVTAEDTLLAGAIIDQLIRKQVKDSAAEVELCGDDAILAHELWKQWCPGDELPTPETLAGCLAKSRGGRNLIEVGFEFDLRHCAQVNSTRTVPKRFAINPPTFGR